MNPLLPPVTGLGDHHLVLAVLSTLPRTDRAGRPVRQAVWNRAATERILDTLGRNGRLVPSETDPRPAEPPMPPDDDAVKAWAIVSAVADVFNVAVPVLLGPARDRQVVQARQAAMYLCRTHLGLSYPKLGELFDRDHSTVLYAVRAVTQRLRTDDQVRLNLAACRRAMPQPITAAAGAA